MRRARPVLGEPQAQPPSSGSVRSARERGRKRRPPGFFPAWARPANGNPWQGPRRPPGSLRPPPRRRTREPVICRNACECPPTPPLGYHPFSRGDGPIGSILQPEILLRRATRRTRALEQLLPPAAAGGQVACRPVRGRGIAPQAGR